MHLPGAGRRHHQLAPVRWSSHWSSERLVLTLALDVRVVSDHGNTTCLGAGLRERDLQRPVADRVVRARAGSSAPCWLPGIPARGWLLLRYASKDRGQRPLDLVDPRPQEPPVPPGTQRLVLGVQGGDQLLEQVADLSRPDASLVVGCVLGQQVPPAHEVDQLGPQWWPRQCPLPWILRSQDRRQLGAGGGASVLLQRSSLSVPGRPPARSPEQPAGNQRDNQDDEQGPAEGSQPLGLGGRGRCACSRGRGGGGRCRGLSRGRGRGRRRVRTLGRGGVRVGRVGSVVVSLGDSVPLGSGRVPERSVEGRVAESLPPPAPQPLSARTRLSTSPARSHAVVVRRPEVLGSARRFLVADTIRRDTIQNVRIDDHLRIGRDRRGEHARHATAAILRPGGPPGITQSG
jgi:hypothetical protein